MRRKAAWAASWTWHRYRPRPWAKPRSCPWTMRDPTSQHGWAFSVPFNLDRWGIRCKCAARSMKIWRICVTLSPRHFYVIDGFVGTQEFQKRWHFLSQSGQSHSGWSMRRPLSANSTPSGPRLSRAVGTGNSSPRQPLSSRLRPQEITDKVAASTSTAATGAGVAYRPPGMLQPQRIELPGYLNTPARRPDGEPLSPEERSTSIRKIKDLETGCFQANFIPFHSCTFWTCSGVREDGSHDD